jgi:hypothetical protein
MFLVPVILLAALLVVVFIGNSMKKKGSMSESAYQNLVSASSVVVTIAALAVLYMRIRG